VDTLAILTEKVKGLQTIFAGIRQNPGDAGYRTGWWDPRRCKVHRAAGKDGTNAD
jgi:hypothetical protein